MSRSVKYTPKNAASAAPAATSNGNGDGKPDYNDPATVIALMVQKLASSLLTRDDAEALGMTPMLAKTTAGKSYWKNYKLPGLYIPYFDPLTVSPVKRRDKEFHRVRALVIPPEAEDDDDFGKYMQPAKTGCVAYFPRYPTIDWPKVLNDTAHPLILTEGELKAAAGVKFGFNMIGLGGVWNFRRGSTLLPELTAIKWEGRLVYITFDSDADTNPQIKEAIRVLANLLITAGAKVFRVAMPALTDGGKTGLDDLLVAKGEAGPAEVRRLLEEAIELAFVPDLPVIAIAAGELDRMATEAEAALIASGIPVYQRGISLVIPRHLELQLKDGSATRIGGFSILNKASLIDILCGAAEFKRFNVRTGTMVTTDPPKDVVDILLARVGRWSFPSIVGVTTTPTLRPDGSIITEPGYDAPTRLYYLADPNLKLPDMPVGPTRADAEAALAVLQDLIEEFPFETPVDRAVALSGILTTVARGMFDVVPMHVVDASTAGTGKSYLIDVISLIATGRITPTANGADKAELDKHLCAKLITGAPIITIDNVNGEIGGDLLCQVIERPSVSIRPFGANDREHEIEARCTTFANGNGIMIVGDAVRRAVKCTLNADIERPELRQFKKNPEAMVMADRGRYIGAAMTIVRAYLAAGKPGVIVPRLGSFGLWSDVVRSSLVWLGCEDVVVSIERARDDDPELEKRRQFLDNVPDHLIGVNITSKIIASVAMERMPGDGEAKGELIWPDFHAAVLAVTGGDRGTITAAAIGHWLKKNRNAIIGDRQIKMVDADRKAAPKHDREWFIKGKPRNAAVGQPASSNVAAIDDARRAKPKARVAGTPAKKRKY